MSILFFKGWATGVALYDPSDALGQYGMDSIGRPPDYPYDFGDPLKTTGAVTGDNFDIVSMGDMDTNEIATHLADPAANPLGTLVLTFDEAIGNGPGADFAAFENGFVSDYTTGGGSVAGEMFAELGYVEVSTDGITYARFPSEYYNQAPLGSQAYLTQDVSNIYNLVGKHANAYGECWGTPFDLDDLIEHPLVLDGSVNLNDINYVKIIDIPGDGTFADSLGNPIYDAWVTWGSGGLDFEALGVINTATLTGDLNGDGFVGLDDLDIILNAWNQNVTIADPTAGDPSGDGFVGLDDLDIVLNNWNTGTPPVEAAIPEPTTALLWAGVLLACAQRRQHAWRE